MRAKRRNRAEAAPPKVTNVVVRRAETLPILRDRTFNPPPLEEQRADLCAASGAEGGDEQPSIRIRQAHAPRKSGA
jgi:hypothetical protein